METTLVNKKIISRKGKLIEIVITTNGTQFETTISINKEYISCNRSFTGIMYGDDIPEVIDDKEKINEIQNQIVHLNNLINKNLHHIE